MLSNFFASLLPVLAIASYASICRHTIHSRTLEQLEVPSLGVRKLDEETLSRLRIRAATHGVSMEEEARRILKEAVSAPARLGDLALRLFGRKHGVDIELPEQETHEPMDLSE